MGLSFDMPGLTARQTRARIVLLLCMVTFLLAGGLRLLQMSQAEKLRTLLESQRRELQHRFDGIVKLKSDSLISYSYDSSYWDELVNFVHTADVQWARDIIDTALPTYQIFGAWIYRPDMSLVYATSINFEEDAATLLPLSADTLQRQLGTQPFSHFFVSTRAGVLEISTAPIHPSSDYQRKTPPQGYFIVSRLWDVEYLDTLGQIIQSRVSFKPAADSDSTQNRHKRMPERITIEKPLNNWINVPVAVLEVHHDIPALGIWYNSLNAEFLRFIGAALLLLALLYAFLSRLVTEPLRLIADALGRENDAPLATLRNSPTEFGQIARLIGDFFAQRSALVAENQERRQLQSELIYLANHDALTGLPNRTLFRERLEQSLRNASRHRQHVAVMYADLDLFKHVNDTLGHHVGDQVLQKVAQRLLGCVRLSDTVARVGGDEYLLCLNEVGSRAGAAQVAAKILDTLSQPLMVDGHEIFAGASLGISLYPADGEDPETLVKHADGAMYHAKEHGRNSYQFFDIKLRDRTTRRMTIENALRRAIERQELALHYQPRFALPNQSIKVIEALLRWNHPDLGAIAPDVFIPLAEESGLIVPIGEWVLRTACRQARQWQMQGAPDFRVAVNMSARQFREKNLARTIIQILDETRLRPEYLELELTESLLMQNFESAAETMSQLAVLGIRFSIDDFGVGYSSLGYLRRLPIDTIKIDRSFVRDLGVREDSNKLISAIVSMAHGLQLNVVAEGVENHDQLSILRTHGCNEIQGYLLCHPLRADDIQQVYFPPVPALKSGTAGSP